MIQVEEPWLLTSSPPCTTFRLRNVSNGKRDPGVVQEEEELGKARMRTAMKCCKQQRSRVPFISMSTQNRPRHGRCRRWKRR